MADYYVDSLKRAGWPTDVLVLDFENHFSTEYSLSKMSTVEYITDDRYEVLGLAYLRQRAGRSDGVAGFDHDVEDVLRWCQKEYGPNLEGCTVVAQNARYDGMVLALKHGVHPPHVVDLLGLAMALYPGHRNDLDSICTREGLPAKGDTKEFKGFGWDERIGPPGPKPHVFGRKKDTREFREIRPGVFQQVFRHGMDEEMRLNLAEYAKNDATQEYAAFKLYLPRLTRPGVELPVMQQTLDMFWRPSIRVDFEIGEELATAMEAKVDEAAESVDLTPTIMRSQKFPPIIQEALGNDPLPMKEGKKGLIPAIAKEDEGRKFLLEHPDPRVRKLMEAYIEVKSWPLHSARVRKIMAQAAALDGWLAVPLKYMGAHTGRWSGGEKINLQNLSKRTLILLMLRMRALLMAPPGHKLVNTDASQIEARILAWLADQMDLVEDFARHVPVYCKFASRAMGKLVRPPREDDPKPLLDTMKRYRTMGKIGVLGCGYAMGKNQCQHMATMIYHIDITLEQAGVIVDYYRKTNDKIVAYWKRIEGAVKYVVRYPHETTELTHGLRLRNDGGTVVLTLPSGRELYYHGMRLSLMQKKGFSRETEQLWYPDPIKTGAMKYVYGGLLTENIVQALARDVLAESMLLADDWGREIGMRVGHHVHDEMLAVVPEEYAERGLEIQLASLRTVPSWAEGLPLDAEGSIKDRWYDK